MLDFYIPFMIITIIITIIFALIYTLTTKKFYSIFYILSMLTYVNFSAYIIDAFDMTKNGIIITLFISSLIMMLIGAYFNQKKTKKSKGFSFSKKQSAGILIGCLIIVLSLFILNMTSPKVIINEKIIENNINQIYKNINNEEYPNYDQQINILEVTLTNKGYLSKVYETENYYVCLNNNAQKIYNSREEYIEIKPKSNKIITYKIDPRYNKEYQNSSIRFELYKTNNEYYYSCDDIKDKFPVIYETIIEIN